MSDPGRDEARPAIDRQKIAGWFQTLFKGTAYLTLIFLDVLVIDTVLNHFDTIVPAGWFAIFWLACANVIMFPKISRNVFVAIGVVLALVVFVLLCVAAYLWLPTLPTSVVLIFVGAFLVYALFQKLDAINANLARANELKQRELKRARESLPER
jgi:hypothetical protein